MPLLPDPEPLPFADEPETEPDTDPDADPEPDPEPLATGGCPIDPLPELPDCEPEPDALPRPEPDDALPDEELLDVPRPPSWSDALLLTKATPASP